MLQINFVLPTKGCNLNLSRVITHLACHAISCKTVFLLCNEEKICLTSHALEVVPDPKQEHKSYVFSCNVYSVAFH